MLDLSRNGSLILITNGLASFQVVWSQHGLNIFCADIRLPPQQQLPLEGLVYLSDDALFAVKRWLAQRDKTKKVLFYGRGHTPSNEREAGYEEERVHGGEKIEEVVVLRSTASRVSDGPAFFLRLL